MEQPVGEQPEAYRGCLKNVSTVLHLVQQLPHFLLGSPRPVRSLFTFTYQRALGGDMLQLQL